MNTSHHSNNNSSPFLPLPFGVCTFCESTCHNYNNSFLFPSSQEIADSGEVGLDHGGLSEDAGLPEGAGGRAAVPWDPKVIHAEEGAAATTASCWREIAEIESMLRQVRASQREAEFQCSVAEMEGEDAQVMQKLLNKLSAQSFKEECMASSAQEKR